MEKGWMKNKTFLRICSFLAAFVLWFFVITTEDPPRSEKIRDVEIVCGLNQEQLDDGLNILYKSCEKLEFTAYGKRSFVTGVRGGYYAKLNLDFITEPGKYMITPEISKPDGVTIKSLEPSVVEVYIDRYVTSVIPVKVIQKNKPAEGLVVKNIEAAQKQISITAPSLEKISYVGLEIDMENIRENSTVTCDVAFFDSNDNLVDDTGILTNVKEIPVTVEIEQHKTVEVVPDIRINGQLPEDGEVSSTPNKVEIHGNPEVIANVDRLSTRPIMLDSSIEIGKEYETNIILPEGVNLKDGTTDDVKITIKNKNE